MRLGGMWHLLIDHISEILSVLIVVPLQVLQSFTCPSSNGFWSDHRHFLVQLHRLYDKQSKEQSTTNQERLQVKRQ